VPRVGRPTGLKTNHPPNGTEGQTRGSGVCTSAGRSTSGDVVEATRGPPAPATPCKPASLHPRETSGDGEHQGRRADDRHMESLSGQSTPSDVRLLSKGGSLSLSVSSTVLPVTPGVVENRGSEGVEARVIVTQGGDVERSQVPAHSTAAQTPPKHSQRRKSRGKWMRLKEVTSSLAPVGVAESMTAPDTASAALPEVSDEVEWEQMRQRLMQLRRVPKPTMGQEEREERVASSEMLEKSPPLAHEATTEETQLAAKLCAISGQVVDERSSASSAPSDKAESRPEVTTADRGQRCDRTQANGRSWTQLNPNADVFVPSNRTAIDRESVPLRGEQLSSTRENESYRVGVATAKSRSAVQKNRVTLLNSKLVLTHRDLGQCMYEDVSKERR
jgi:hypothetical protein